MEITIKAICPNCRENIVFDYSFKEKTFEKDDKIKEFVFDITKKASLKAYAAAEAERKELFSEIFGLLKKDLSKLKYRNYINLCLRDFERQINFAKTKKGLNKIKKNLLKSKLSVSKDLLKYFDKKKKKFVKKVDKKLKSKRK